MNFSDACFSEKIRSDLCNNKPECSGHIRIPRVKYEQNLQKLIDWIKKSEKPVNYYEISEYMNFKLVRTTKAGGICQCAPDRARNYVKDIIRRHPDEFELVYLLRRNTVGGFYEKPHIKVKEGELKQ